MSNRSNGTAFESELCSFLSENGFWAHNMAQNKAGQPADVIACKNGEPFLIDCKLCNGSRFVMNRIEANQSYAMTVWEAFGNGKGLFAIKFNDFGTYMIDIDSLKKAANGLKSVSYLQIMKHGKDIQEWVGEKNQAVTCRTDC